MATNRSLDRNRLDVALTRARVHLLRQMSTDGAYRDVTDVGPGSTAIPLIALEFAGHPLPPEEKARVIAWLRRQQRSDGSFAGYPFAPRGDLCATALCWSALRMVGVRNDDPALVVAARFIADNGGLDGVADALLKKTNFAALFLVMAGDLDPQKVPLPPPELLLGQFAQSFLRDHVDFPVVGIAMIAGGAIVEGMRRRAYDHSMETAIGRGFVAATIACRFRAAVIETFRAVESLSETAAVDFLANHQNPNGSLDDTTLQTSLLLGALRAAGLPQGDARVAKAAKWLRSMLAPTPDGAAWFSGFSGDVWATALALRALRASGTPAGDPTLTRTIQWLLGHQISEPRLVRSRTRAGAPKTGGWAFEGHNVTMPDCDDTGLVLVSLGLVADQSAAEGGLDDPLRERVSAAMERACAWLEGTQNPDGGWSAFDYWEGSKPRGPLYTREGGIVTDNVVDTLKNLLDPPITLGSPAWEDVTARVIYGLGCCGLTVDAPIIARAVEFLRFHQLDHGGWWGRWMVNYLPTTAYVLLGLWAVGVDLKEEWIGRAVDFLLAHQNSDGGWGEGEETYRSPDLAGCGPSMPPLTGLVLSALIRCGHADAPAVARGVAYLLAELRPDGTWPNAEWLHAFFPPQSFYVYFLMPSLYPLEALGLYREWKQGRALAEPRARVAPRLGRPRAVAHEELSAPILGPIPPRWDDTFLDAMRQIGDAAGDLLVRDVLAAEGLPAHELLRVLVGSDAPIPEGLPAGIHEFLAQEALPDFADHEQLALAQELFARAGWSVATGLLCSSLPQTYAAARGAKVLVHRGRLEVDARRRILETAQFVFDVTDRGGLVDGGRGVRSAQKVRLIHATIRTLVAGHPSWSRVDGLPINQEDLAGTLMAFSSVILSALDRLGVAATAREREAWIHLWKVVGALIGVDPALLPEGEDDATALIDLVRRRQWASSPQGTRLAESLVRSMQEYMPGPAFQQLPIALVRHLAGDACADLLGLPRSDWTNLFLETCVDLQGALSRRERHSHLGRVFERFQGALMKGMIGVQRLGKGTALRLPSTLRPL